MKKQSLHMTQTKQVNSTELSTFFRKEASLEQLRKQREDSNLREAINKATGGKNIVVSNCGKP